MLPQVRGADRAQPGISRLEALASPPGWSSREDGADVGRGDQPTPRRSGWQTWTRTTIRGVRGRCPAVRRSANGRVGRTRTSTRLRPRQVGYPLPYDPMSWRLLLVGSRGFEPRSARSERAASANCATSRGTTLERMNSLGTGGVHRPIDIRRLSKNPLLRARQLGPTSPLDRMEDRPSLRPGSRCLAGFRPKQKRPSRGSPQKAWFSMNAGPLRRFAPRGVIERAAALIADPRLAG